MEEKHDGSLEAPMDLRVWVRLLSCAMRIEKRLRRNFAEQFDTTLPRFDVMASLDRYPDGQTMGDLSRALLVSNGNVTSIVRQLEAQKLVETNVDPNDRRSAIVTLTPEGKTLFKRMARDHQGWVRDAMKDFPREKQQQLYDLLADLKVSIGRS
ncbi:MAG: MarR family winged helix-turn-helix transcriptional regulator [Alphaproteobacteria bacterium]